MRISIRGLLAALGLAALLVGFDAATHEARAEIASINEAINKAGFLRYTSQRLAKVYLQIGQNIDAEHSKKILDGSVKQFEQRLAEVKDYAPTPDIRNTYVELERVWASYRLALTGAAPSQAGARNVVEISDEVMRLAHQGATQLAKHSGTTEGVLINISGRQRMLSQRMAKLYLATSWGVAPANAAEDFAKTREEFVAGLEKLSAAPVNTSAINNELQLASQQWMFFQNALLNNKSEKKVAALNVATTSERILEVMNNVVAMYEKLTTSTRSDAPPPGRKS